MLQATGTILLSVSVSACQSVCLYCCLYCCPYCWLSPYCWPSVRTVVQLSVRPSVYSITRHIRFRIIRFVQCRRGRGAQPPKKILGQNTRAEVDLQHSRVFPHPSEPKRYRIIPNNSQKSADVIQVLFYFYLFKILYNVGSAT